MNQTIRIDESLGDKSLRLLENEITVKLKIVAHIGLTVLVKWIDAKGMVVLDQDNPGAAEDDPETDDSQKQIFSAPHRSQGPLPRAIQLDGDGSEVFMLDALSAGNTITLGKALKQGRAWVEVSDTLPATPENCKIYSETAGMNVTPHPVWRLPGIRIAHHPSQRSTSP